MYDICHRVRQYATTLMMGSAPRRCVGTVWRAPETAIWDASSHGSDGVPVSNIHARNKIRECLCTVRREAAAMA